MNKTKKNEKNLVVSKKKYTFAPDFEEIPILSSQTSFLSSVG